MKDVSLILYSCDVISFILHHCSEGWVSNDNGTAFCASRTNNDGKKVTIRISNSRNFQGIPDGLTEGENIFIDILFPNYDESDSHKGSSQSMDEKRETHPCCYWEEDADGVISHVYKYATWTLKEKDMRKIAKAIHRAFKTGEYISPLKAIVGEN